VPSIETAANNLSPHRSLRQDFFSWGVVAGAFAFPVWLNWRTWPDLLIDFGHELYIPWRISSGDRLYADMAFVMGPLSQHLNALLFRLFGVSLTTLIWANLAILASIVAMLYWIFRRVGSRGSATFVALFFLAVFAFAQYGLIGNYNYVCPYRHEVTHGLALGLANLICLVRLGETRRTGWLLGSGFCLGLIALTKGEMLVPAVLTVVIAIPLVVLCGLRANSGSGCGRPFAGASAWIAARRIGLWLVLTGIVAAVPVAIALIGLTYSMGWQRAVDGILINYKLSFDRELTSRSSFYGAVSGFDNPGTNATAVCLSSVALAAVALAAFVFSLFVDRAFPRVSRSNVWTIVAGTAAAFATTLLLAPTRWSSIPLALPVLLPVIVLVSLCQTIQQWPLACRPITVLLLAVYAAGLLPKILLNVGWGHYGFVLAMPGMLLLVHVAIDGIPSWMSRRFGSSGTFRALAIGLFAACAVYQSALWLRIDGAKSLAIGKGGDLFYADPNHDDRSLPIERTLDYLQRIMRDDETLAVLPEGVILNYLLRKRNPTPFLIFNPWELDVHGGEERVSGALIDAAPDYMVIVTLDLSVFGRGQFGSPQYGGRIHEFLEDRYEIVGRQVSGSPPTFQALVFKKRRDR
jgi:hypothetical protein